ncbi:MAG: alanine--tRNA ligase [Myxococcales bacterium]|nr:alanine--tRNA ligase [Myxococcales bacterium]
MFEADVYSNDFFESAGFLRKQCPSGAWFWTLDPERVYSGDQEGVEYTFIGRQVFDGQYTLAQLRERALRWYEAQGHARMGSYPVLASLWRDDLLFNSASICDFQPHVIERQLEPPANPLVVAQKCVRLNDLENVGRSGRHLSSFTMLGHHAFNFEGEPEIYWISRTVELCHRFFTEELGADPKGITYVESAWAGGGNAGPCVEVMYEGIEIATLVFMSLAEDPDGEHDIKGVRYTAMPTRVVDTGYGLERVVWASQGTPNIYAAVSPGFLEKLVERTGFAIQGGIIDDYFRKMSSQDIETPLQYEKVQRQIAAELGVTPKELARAVRPAETLFTLCDFTRTLLLMLNDHVLPSNKDAGYLVRQLAKRIMVMLEEEQIDITPMELLGMQFDAMASDFPELEGKRETAQDIIAAELERHETTMERGRNQLIKEIKKLKKKKRTVFPNDKIFYFYDTLGLPLHYTREVIEEESDLELELTDEAWREFFNKSMALDAKKEARSWPEGQAATDRLYYEDPYATTGDAKVLSVHGDWVVLDQTIFYPEGGGQPYDTGALHIDGSELEVVEVQYHNGTIFHRLAEAPGDDLRGEQVSLSVDWSRRYGLMRAHSATHLLNATLREVLGFHVRQMGAQKGVESSRFDIAHYRTITPGQIQEIEGRINEVIFSGAPITTEVMQRGSAESRYGFFIYQGGFVPFDQLRIVTLGEGGMDEAIDIEACAGTHLRDIREAALFKLLEVKQIQNNVYRLRYSVGDEALSFFQQSEQLLNKVVRAVGSSRDDALQKVTNLMEETKEQSKLLSGYEESLIQLQANASRDAAESKPTLYFFKSPVPKDRAMRHIIRMARTGKNQAFFVIFEDGALFIRSKDLKAIDFKASSEQFGAFELLKASPDMVILGGRPEAGAAWDVGRRLMGRA